MEEGEHLFALDVQGYFEKRENPWRVNQAHIKSKVQVKLDYPDRYLAQYPDIFSEEGFDQLPPRQPWDHCIESTPDFIPMNCKIYALTLDEQKALDEFLEENLQTGRIRPSNSPMASPFFFILKTDGSLRPVQDY